MAEGTLIRIGESLHASIPRTGSAMRALYEKGLSPLDENSEPAEFLQGIVRRQADESADYIAVNLDAFGDLDESLPVELIGQYISLIHQFGGGIPACIDSSDDRVLRAGLEAWYRTGEGPAVPMLNSVKVYTMDEMLGLRKDYEFSFIAMLIEEDTRGGAEPITAGRMHELARRIFDRAMEEGFAPGDIYFDTTVFPLAIDMPMQPGQSGYTYRTFEAIRRIRADEHLAGVHCVLGVSNCCRDLPGRKIGICRAFVQKAMEYGLDAGIVNTSHDYVDTPADPELIDLVESFAAQDGDMQAMMDAATKMGQFCSAVREAKSGS